MATTPTAKASTIAIKVAAGSVKPHAKDNITATLKSGTKVIAGATVKLEARAVGAKTWKIVSSRLTGAKGSAAFTVVPGIKKGQKEQYVIVFSGNSKYKASHSAIITVTVV